MKEVNQIENGYRTENLRVERRGNYWQATGYTHNWASDIFVVKGKSAEQALTKLRHAIKGDKDGEWLRPEIEAVYEILLTPPLKETK